MPYKRTGKVTFGNVCQHFAVMVDPCQVSKVSVSWLFSTPIEPGTFQAKDTMTLNLLSIYMIKGLVQTEERRQKSEKIWYVFDACKLIDISR